MRHGRAGRGSTRTGTRTKVGLLAVVACGLVACDDDGTGPPASVEPVEVGAELVVDGLSSPLFLTAPEGDDRLFVVERGGRIVIVEAGSVLPTPFLDISASVTSGGEQGLLGLAFHPDYASNGYFYVDYTDASGGDTQVVRYSVSSDPNVADAGSAFPILSVEQPFDNHNGGMLAFGPDGMLYIALGDGGGGGDPQDNGQSPSTLLGSLLRIDVDGGNPYAIPPDNPFAGDADARGEIWAYGLRNPWRFAFDRQNADLYIADVGQSAREEIDFEPAGSDGGVNYGWNVMEGTTCYEPSSGCSQSGLTLPVHEYTHEDGCSISGGYVYRGSAVPDAVGRYFYADFCRTWVRSIAVTGGQADSAQDHTDGTGEISSIASFGEDGHGELYIVSLDGEVHRLVPPAS